MRKYLPSVDLFLGKTIERFPNHVIKEHVASGNNGHLFRAFDQSTRSNLAFKVIPVENLPKDNSEQQQIYLNEAKKANQIDHQSVVNYIDVIPYVDPESKISCVIFVCNYIKGKNLRYYMKDHKTIEVPFIEDFLRTMFGLLFELQARGFQHGDLHAGNVLVADPEFDVYGRSVFRVTDFGVRELTGPTTHMSDYLYLAETLRQLLGKVSYSDCSGRDRYVYNILKADFLARHLYEIDTSADPYACNPSRLLKKLDSIDDQYSAEKQDSPIRLVSPFDYPNCEQIGNSHLLLKSLYSDRLLGLGDIQARSNLMLTGPRGCGKTTVFRALSLEYLISTENDSPKDLNYIGIYYRCDDLYFNFPRYEYPDRDSAFDVPMHFMIVTLTGTMLEQISAWAKRHFSDEFIKKEKQLAAELWELFGWQTPGDPTAGELSVLANKLKVKETKRAARKQRHIHKESVEGYFGPGMMFDVCHVIRKQFSFLQDRQIYFFIDDYSHPKITKNLQANLNRLVMHRSSDVFFKLSTESPVSFAREDIDGKKYVESREYDLLNLGLRYISSKSEQIAEFLEDLFVRRFKEVEGYPVSNLGDLLGSMPRNENETARAFRDKEGSENYAGVQTIAAMCSGDIHYMIRLVGRMVEDFGGQSALANTRTEPCIPPREQHESIRAAAGSFMESVRTLPRYGQQLANVVSAFGNVAHSYLLYENSSNQTGNPPHQASRIEPYESLDISDEAQLILDELLRYSIFIEDPRGKSRRGQIVPRFYLRRYLIPHFRLTFSRRDSLQLESTDIESLLCNPGEFENDNRLRAAGLSIRQKELFPDE